MTRLLPFQFVLRVVLVLLLVALQLPRCAKAQGAAFSEDGLLFSNLSCARLHRIVERHGSGISAMQGSGPAPRPRDIAYGSSAAQRLDVYAPDVEERNGSLAPMIVMVHGGAWCVGDKGMGRVTSNKVARWVRRGIVFVSVNYRMLPDRADPLAQAGDVATALAFVQSHARDWGGNPDAIVLMGHSAGAHLVSLLDADPALAKRYGAKPWLGTVSLDSAVMNVPELMSSSHAALYDDAFGSDRGYWAKASPQQNISTAMHPWLGVCSSLRKNSCPQAHAFAQAAQQRGVKALVLEQALKHSAINENLGAVGPYTDAVESFIGSLSPEFAQRLPH